MIFAVGALWGMSVSLLDGILVYAFPRIADGSLKKREIKNLIRKYKRIYGIDPRKDNDFLQGEY